MKIALLGRKGAGKRTFAEFLNEERAFTIISFSDPLRSIANEILGENEVQESLIKDLKSFFEGKDERVFVKYIERKIKESETLGYDVVITDIETDEEFEILKKMNFTFVYINTNLENRKSRGFDGEDEEEKFPYDNKMILVDNNGSKDVLKFAAKNITAKFEEPKFIEIPINDKFSIYAEKSDNFREMSIYIGDKNRYFLQDLVMVQPTYTIDDDFDIIHWNDDKMSIKVWSDSDNEDFQVEYIVPVSDAEEDLEDDLETDTSSTDPIADVIGANIVSDLSQGCCVIDDCFSDKDLSEEESEGDIEEELEGDTEGELEDWIIKVYLENENGNSNDACWDTEFFTFDGGTITGLTKRGKALSRIIHRLVIPAFTDSEEEPYVEKIGKGAFANCGFTKVEIPEGVKIIGEDAFINNEIETLFALPDTLKIIGRRAFAYNKIKVVCLPENLETIRRKAFAGNDIKRLTIPDCFVSVQSEAFADNPLEEIILPDIGTRLSKNAFGEKFKDKYWTEEDFIYRDDTILGFSISGHSKSVSLKSLNLPYAYNDYSGKRIELKKIGRAAFSNKGFEKVYIPDTITDIGDYAFYCNNIRGALISPNLEKIGKYAFADNLFTKIIIPGTVETVEEGAFLRNRIQTLYILDGVQEIGESAFKINEISEIDFGNTLKVIRKDAFRNNHLDNFKLPNSTSTVEEGAFDENPCKL